MKHHSVLTWRHPPPLITATQQHAHVALFTHRRNAASRAAFFSHKYPLKHCQPSQHHQFTSALCNITVVVVLTSATLPPVAVATQHWLSTHSSLPVGSNGDWCDWGGLQHRRLLETWRTPCSTVAWCSWSMLHNSSPTNGCNMARQATCNTGVVCGFGAMVCSVTTLIYMSSITFAGIIITVVKQQSTQLTAATAPLLGVRECREGGGGYGGEERTRPAGMGMRVDCSRRPTKAWDQSDEENCFP